MAVPGVNVTPAGVWSWRRSGDRSAPFLGGPSILLALRPGITPAGVAALRDLQASAATLAAVLRQVNADCARVAVVFRFLGRPR
jgi:hypothetical protein